MSDQRGERDSDVDAQPGPGDAAGSAGGEAPGSDTRAVARPSGKRAAARAGSPAPVGEPGDGGSAAAKKGNLFKRILQFLREVVAELRKVIWPDRKQTVTYTIVVFVFLAFMVGLIFGLDQLFARGVLWLLG